MTDLPPPVQLSEREAITTLRVMGAMAGLPVLARLTDRRQSRRARPIYGYALGRWDGWSRVEMRMIWTAFDGRLAVRTLAELPTVVMVRAVSPHTLRPF